MKQNDVEILPKEEVIKMLGDMAQSKINAMREVVKGGWLAEMILGDTESPKEAADRIAKPITALFSAIHYLKEEK